MNPTTTVTFLTALLLTGGELLAQHPSTPTAQGGISPARLVAAAKQRPSPVALQSMRFADGSGSVTAPAGWQLRGQGGMYVVQSDASATPRYAVFSTTRSFMAPGSYGLGPEYQQQMEQCGVVFAAPMSAERTFRMLFDRDRCGSDLRVLGVSSFEEYEPDVQQALRMLASNGMQVDSRMLLCEYTPADGVRRRGVFGVTTMVPQGGSWSALVGGLFGPAETFEGDVPALAQMFASHRIDPQWQQNQRAQQQGAFAAHQNRMAANQRAFDKTQAAMRGVQDAYDSANASWAAGQRSRDYTQDMFTQSIRGESNWVSGWGTGHDVTTSGDGAQDQLGRRAVGSPWNTTNFDGYNPWTGQQMTQVNSFDTWQQWQQRRGW